MFSGDKESKKTKGVERNDGGLGKCEKEQDTYTPRYSSLCFQHFEIVSI